MAKPAPRFINDIRPGLFKIRLVRNGPWSGAAIQHDEACGWYALIDGVRQGEPAERAEDAPEVERIWMYGRFIEHDEYQRLTRAERTINPRAPVSLASAPPVF